MKLPMGMLLEEVLPAYYCSQKEQTESFWIEDIRILNAQESIREHVLYLIPDESTLPEISENWQENIVLLFHENLYEDIYSDFLHVEVPASVNLFTVFSAMQDLFREFAKWQVRIYESCTCGGGLQEIIDITKSITENHVYIADMSFKILVHMNQEIMQDTSATWRYQLSHGYLPVHVMKGMIESGEFEKLNGFHRAQHFYSKHFYVPFVTKNIFYNQKPQAHLFLINIMRRPCWRDIAVAQILGDFIEQHFFILSEYQLNRINSNYENFFNDVLNGTCTEESVILKQLSLFEWTLSGSYCMAVVEMADRDENFRRTIAYQVESTTDFMSFMHGSDLVMLKANPENQQKKIKDFLKGIARHYSLNICIGKIYTDFMEMREQYTICKKIIKIAGREKNLPDIIEVEEYSFQYILNEIYQTPRLRSLCSDQALKLRAYDRIHGTDYFDTYGVYLTHDRNIVDTSRNLHIHRNTLMYRLDKIHKIIDIDEEKYETRILMLLSILILRTYAV